jgi:tetratricopeptide (TPR) repeat protein
MKSYPKNVAAHNGLGLLLEKQKRYDEAIEVYRKACDDNPDNGIAFQNLAFTLIYLNRLDEAEEIYKKAMRIAPGHPIAESIKSRLLKAKG